MIPDIAQILYDFNVDLVDHHPEEAMYGFDGCDPLDKHSWQTVINIMNAAGYLVVSIADRYAE